MELRVLHYHFRPGGVRRVLELGLPALARARGCRRVTLAAGEVPPPEWRAHMESSLHPCTVEWFVEPALGYLSEQTRSAPEIQIAIREALRLLVSDSVPLWVHNLSVGRNMLLARELAALADSACLWMHHHDFWWDGRWERWPEMQAAGFTSFAEAVAVTLPGGPLVSHSCVNLTDARRLAAWTGDTFRFVPNPLAPPAAATAETAAAREWLRRATGADHWWLYPCRGLRRKNIAEALWVQKTCAPHAVTVTTAGASSAQEGPYFQRLTSAAVQHGWPLFAGLAAQEGRPSVPALMNAADMVAVTSLREGFGLPFCEAALASRPCCGRVPAGLGETMKSLGVPLLEQWHGLPVSRGAFDEKREAVRTASGRERLVALLPPELHAAARALPPPSHGEYCDFGALSLDAQLEVLASSCTPPPPFGSRLSSPPASVPAFSYPWDPEAWALQCLLPEPDKSRNSGWEHRAASVLAPLLHHWLRHPLLWPEPTAAAVCK